MCDICKAMGIEIGDEGEIVEVGPRDDKAVMEAFANKAARGELIFWGPEDFDDVDEPDGDLDE